MFDAILRCSLEYFLEIITGIYVHQSTEANIKVSSWLLKESRMYVFSKEGMRNEITFYKWKYK